MKSSANKHRQHPETVADMQVREMLYRPFAVAGPIIVIIGFLTGHTNTVQEQFAAGLVLLVFAFMSYKIRTLK